MDAEELKRSCLNSGQRLAVSDAVQPPKLVRPDVAQGEPVTDALAHWAIRVVTGGGLYPE